MVQPSGDRPVDVAFVKIEKLIDKAIVETDDMVAKYKNRQRRRIAVGKGIFDPDVSYRDILPESPMPSHRSRARSADGKKKPKDTRSSSWNRSGSPRSASSIPLSGKKPRSKTPDPSTYHDSLPVKSQTSASDFPSSPSESPSSTSKKRRPRSVQQPKRVGSPTPETFYPGKKVVDVIPDPQPGEKVYRSLDNSHLLYLREVPCGVSRRAVKKIDDPRPRLIAKLRKERKVPDSLSLSISEKEKSTDGSDTRRTKDAEKSSPDSDRKSDNSRDPTPSEKSKSSEKPKKKQKDKSPTIPTASRSRSRSTKSKSRPKTPPETDKEKQKMIDIEKMFSSFGFDTTLNIFHPNCPDEKYHLKISTTCPEFKVGHVYVNDKPVKKLNPNKMYPEILDN